MADNEHQHAEGVRHKIVEHTLGAGRWCSCRCLCGWTKSASSLERLDALTELHIDGTPEAHDG